MSAKAYISALLVSGFILVAQESPLPSKAEHGKSPAKAEEAPKIAPDKQATYWRELSRYRETQLLLSRQEAQINAAVDALKADCTGGYTIDMAQFQKGVFACVLPAGSKATPEAKAPAPPK